MQEREQSRSAVAVTLEHGLSQNMVGYKTPLGNLS